MSETIEIDDVHEFMLDKIVAEDADHSDVVESLIYQAHQMQKQQEQQAEPETEEVSTEGLIEDAESVEP